MGNKILILNGTHATKGLVGFKRNGSNTGFVLEQVKESLLDYFPDWTVDIIELNSLNIQPCNSCAICCVPGGRCPLQDNELDNVDYIVKKMEESDVFIFGSPVYCMNVSGKAKMFIDRLAQYVHLPLLIAKPCISVTTFNLSDSTVQQYVELWLKMMGAKYIGNIGANVFADMYSNLTIVNEEEFHTQLTDCIQLLRQVISGESDIFPSEQDKQLFESVKQRWINYKKYTKHVYAFWKDRDLLNAEYYY